MRFRALGFFGASVALLGSIGTASSNQAPAGPAFDVVSIKQNKSGDGRITVNTPPGGRFNGTNMPVRFLIALAYGTPQPLPPSRMEGGPDWIDSERFDVEAVAPSDFGQSPLAPQLQLMLRTLLGERFKLVEHHETRDLAIYALVLARSDGKLGPQLKKTDVDCVALNAGRPGGAPPAPTPGQRPQCGMYGGLGRVAAGSIAIAQLVSRLEAEVGRTVLDKTDLEGRFDIDLSWTPAQLPPPAPGTPTDAPLRVNGFDVDRNGPSLFTALQEQLGLKLESQKDPVDVLVIDHVEHPTEN